MTGPTFILSIWVLVDGALGTEDSKGAAAHTVGPISKMGTLGTSIRALNGREMVRKYGIPRSTLYSQQELTQSFGFLPPWPHWSTVAGLVPLSRFKLHSQQSEILRGETMQITFFGGAGGWG